MRLYSRDYTSLTQEEEAEWADVRRREDESAIGPAALPVKKSLYIDYPKAARHFLEPFPNNYLDFLELRDTTTLEKKLAAFELLLNTQGVTERAVLNHIRENQSYFIVGSLLKYKSFGHHAAFVFPEFRLGTTYQADYLVVGQNSHGYHFVFVELEAPSGQITRNNGELGTVCRKGLEQVSEWRRWLEKNYSALQEAFDGYKKQGDLLPDEFSRLDTTRLHYVVVAGRRADFTDETRRIARELPGNTDLLHYDNLVDRAREVIGAITY